MNVRVTSILNYLKKSNLKYDYRGKMDISINRYSSLDNVKNNSITWVKNQSYYKEELFIGLKDVILVVNLDIDVEKIHNKDSGVIICKNPKEVFFSILNEFFKQEAFNAFISSNSVIKTEKIGQNVYIGHNCYVGKDVIVGHNVIIKNNVVIEGNVKIGKNTIIHSGVVIGSDGFGYFKDNENKNTKVCHYGGVIIGNDVEIGANTCIDRGTLDNTVIGNNVKINNLCHIAHNVKVKDSSIITASCIIAGSVVLEKNVYVAPGAIIRNQLTVGENCLIGMGAVVTKDVDKNKIIAGVPAKIIRENDGK